jgi:hypothetical protein
VPLHKTVVGWGWFSSGLSNSYLDPKKLSSINPKNMYISSRPPKSLNRVFFQKGLICLPNLRRPLVD